MAAASISHSGSAAPSLAFEDYSLYSNLSDDELLHLAIERSLTDRHSNTTNTAATATMSPHQPDSNSLNSAARNANQPSYSPHNPPANYSSHNPPLAQTSAHYSSPNPPSETPPDPRTFDGTVSHFMTGSGKRMVAYRKADGSLVHIAPEPEDHSSSHDSRSSWCSPVSPLLLCVFAVGATTSPGTWFSSSPDFSQLISSQLKYLSSAAAHRQIVPSHSVDSCASLFTPPSSTCHLCSSPANLPSHQQACLLPSSAPAEPLQLTIIIHQTFIPNCMEA